jgi:glc operon protein GlcG
MKVTGTIVKLTAAAALASLGCLAYAQVPSYGTNINLEQAKKVIAAGQAEAKKNAWPVAIAVVDTAGNLVAFEKWDDTQTASIEVSQDKARSSAIYRRTSKVFEDMVAGGAAGTRALNLRNASTVEGGVPITVGGKIIGAVGVSGVTSQQDGIVAKAGAEALK